MYSLLWCADVLVTEVSGVYESTETVLQPCPHSNTLTWAAAIIKMLPNLNMCACKNMFIVYTVVRKYMKNGFLCVSFSDCVL